MQWVTRQKTVVLMQMGKAIDSTISDILDLEGEPVMLYHRIQGLLAILVIELKKGV